MKKKTAFCFTLCCLLFSGCAFNQKTVYRCFAVYQLYFKGTTITPPYTLGTDEDRKTVRTVSSPDTVRVAYLQTPAKKLSVDGLFYNARRTSFTVTQVPEGETVVGRRRADGNSVALPKRNGAVWWKISFLSTPEVDASKPSKKILIRGRLDSRPFQVAASENIELEPAVAM